MVYLVSDEDLASLGKAMIDLKIKKDLIQWHLEELEAATQEDLERESDSDDDSESDLERPAPL
jgi:protein SHQ1